MADRQRSIAADLKSEAKTRRARSVLIYGEQRYEYAKDVPYKTQMAANYAWVGWCGMLAGQVAAVPFVASIPSM